MKILVTGSSGLVGSALLSFLKTEGYEVFKLVRARSELHPDEIAWTPDQGVISPELLEGFDAIVHLAGENISDSRWTEQKKKKILDSRVIGTRLLCQALSTLKQPPRTLIAASAIGYYGDQEDRLLTEESPPGHCFLSDVCQQWEAATDKAKEKGIRVVNLRIGVVLSHKGGALQSMLTPFKWGLGGVLGSGKQYFSWIVLEDLIRIIGFALKNEALQGPINAVSPHPVTNYEFTKTLGKVLHRPTFMRMPAFVAQIVFGEMADELLLSSARVIPKRLEQTNFHFSFPELEQALTYLLLNI
jgi:uncharacterized protein